MIGAPTQKDLDGEVTPTLAVWNLPCLRHDTRELLFILIELGAGAADRQSHRLGGLT